VDFKDIKFATRSFIDEFYNLFLKDASSLPFKVEITNVGTSAEMTQLCGANVVQNPKEKSQILENQRLAI